MATMTEIKAAQDKLHTDILAAIDEFNLLLADGRLDSLSVSMPRLMAEGEEGTAIVHSYVTSTDDGAAISRRVPG